MTPPEPTAALSDLVPTLAEDALFALSAGGGEVALEGLAKRRSEAYASRMKGAALFTMKEHMDAWLVDMTKAIAPVWAPHMLPMGDVIREKVTLELGARGIRSLFSSKPSDKDVIRVKRLGTLCVRVVRAIFAADAPLDAEENLNIAALVSALGLSPEDAAPLLVEPPFPADQLEVYGDVEPNIAKAIVRGAWLAAAWDTIDPREELVVRTVALKLALPLPDIEELRKEALERVEARKLAGLATVDAVRFMLSDVPSELASRVAVLMLPKCHREEGERWIAADTKVTLSKKFSSLSTEEKEATLGMAWAAALHSNPNVGRRALLRARHERFSKDLGKDGAPARALVETWMNDVLAPLAAPLEAT